MLPAQRVPCASDGFGAPSRARVGGSLRGVQLESSSSFSVGTKKNPSELRSGVRWGRKGRGYLYAQISCWFLSVAPVLTACSGCTDRARPVGPGRCADDL